MVWFLVSIENVTFPAWYLSSCNHINHWAFSSFSQKDKLLSSSTHLVLPRKSQLCRSPGPLFSWIWPLQVSQNCLDCQLLNGHWQFICFHCIGFSFSSMSFQPEVLSNTYYSTDIWFYIYWKFHMGAFLKKNKCINCLQFGLLSFVESKMLHIH